MIAGGLTGEVLKVVERVGCEADADDVVVAMAAATATDVFFLLLDLTLG